MHPPPPPSLLFCVFTSFSALHDNSFRFKICIEGLNESVTFYDQLKAGNTGWETLSQREHGEEQSARQPWPPRAGGPKRWFALELNSLKAAVVGALRVRPFPPRGAEATQPGPCDPRPSVTGGESTQGWSKVVGAAWRSLRSVGPRSEEANLTPSPPEDTKSHFLPFICRAVDCRTAGGGRKQAESASAASPLLICKSPFSPLKHPPLSTPRLDYYASSAMSFEKINK